MCIRTGEYWHGGLGWLFAVMVMFGAGRTAAQTAPEADSAMRAICDSIVVEGNLLYRYEKAAWEATDIGRQNEQVARELFDLLVYQRQDTIRVCLLDRDLLSICEVDFTGPDNEVRKSSFVSRALSEAESRLFFLKNELINRVMAGEYGVGVAESYGLNFVLIPDGEGYRFYILTGTTLPGIIPFGNDYLFFADAQGGITGWRKMHSVLLPMSREVNGQAVKNTIHSHRPEEPYMTATDICTFKLYGPLCGQDSFTVVSPLQKVMTYRLTTDSIEVWDLDRKPRRERKKR